MKFITDKFIYDDSKEISGLTPELIALYVDNYFKSNNENVVLLTSNMYEANNYFKLLQEYNDDTLFFPMDDFITSMAVAVSPDFKLKRLDTLDKINSENKKHIIVTSLMGYLKFLPSTTEKQCLTVTPLPQNISREIILDTLEEFGYHRDSLVTSTGEYAVRGFVIDVFPIGYDHPFRIEFFGDEIDEIKEFDENTQLTLKKVESFDLKRVNETINQETSSLMDYVNNESLFIIDNNQLEIAYKMLSEEIVAYNEKKEITTKHMYELNEIKAGKIFKVNSLNLYKTKNQIVYNSKTITNFNSNFDNLKRYALESLLSKTVLFALSNDKQIERIKELFDEVYLKHKKIVDHKINIIKSNLKNGFIFEDYIIIGPYDIESLKTKNVKYKNPIKMGHKIKNFDELTIGDYIVHESYGIGIYNGIKTLKKGEYLNDYIQLLYADNDKVYVSVDNIGKLYKYSSKYSSVKLNKLNSPAWTKKKLAARQKIDDIKEELIKLYQERSKIKKDKMKDYPEEEAFAFEFPYELTKDQEKCIYEINEDLKSTIPMDRLLCGDVGYGKTEVAFRAMFKTVLNGGCVAYLCPTTILSRQQYENALERFKNYPVNIALLNRYTSQAETSKIIEKLKTGKIDILFGTHKLLNDKIDYKNLKLLVVDEEQRFGVKHKEKIKGLKNDINVLTLSATPIPRTLKMAMSGLRGLSILDTPPVNRYPIETYVIEENELIIRDAIYKELSRDGQTYILVNNIEEMQALVTKIKELVPNASVVGAHGQMNSNDLNGIMQDFVKGNYDILVCTTIIETGIDIPNVNTIIIIDSDNFGLSQLYQIRGRVGRSDKIAYAYLMYKPSKILTETATKRLESIKEFTELGSGYKIALRDLSIRGAGDILGKEQAGFIEAIGLDLYTKLINEEISGEKEEETEKKMLNISTHIDDNYTEDESIKIEIHKMINEIKTKKDLTKVKEELEDRFGNVPEEIEIYMIEKCIENIFEELNIKNIIQTTREIEISLPKEVSDKINGEKLFLEVYNINPKFKLSYKSGEIHVNLNLFNLQKNYIYYIFDLVTIIHNQVK